MITLHIPKLLQFFLNFFSLLCIRISGSSSKEERYGTKNLFKYFIGYNDNDVVRPLCVKLSQMTGYAKKFDDNVTISFKINDKQLLKKYNQIWKKVEKLLKAEFDSKRVYGDDDKYIKTKIKIYARSMITNFHNKKIPKEKVPCKCLSIIILDSVIKAKKSIILKHFWKNVNINKKK